MDESRHQPDPVAERHGQVLQMMIDEYQMTLSERKAGRFADGMREELDAIEWVAKRAGLPIGRRIHPAILEPVQGSS